MTQCGFRQGSGRVDHGFVHQHDGDVVAHRIDAAALSALEALPPVFVFEYQRLLTHGADQNLEQVRGNHEWHFTLFELAAETRKILTAKRARIFFQDYAYKRKVRKAIWI